METVASKDGTAIACDRLGDGSPRSLPLRLPLDNPHLERKRS